MKLNKAIRIIARILLMLFAVLLLFILGTFIYHRVKTNGELELLKEKGYYNPVSVGDYSLNVAIRKSYFKTENIRKYIA